MKIYVSQKVPVTLENKSDNIPELCKFNTLQKFDIKKLDKSSVSLIIGKRECGKSCLMKDILLNHTNNPSITCISGSKQESNFHKTYINESCVYSEYKDEIIEGIIETQKNKYINTNYDSNHDLKPDTVLLLDSVDQYNIFKNDSIREIFLNGRCYKISLVISIQYLLSLPPILRSNADFVFVFRENINEVVKKLYDNYFGQFKNLEEFRNTLNYYTNDYSCLVLDMTSKSSNLQDCVFWYKSELNSDTENNGYLINIFNFIKNQWKKWTII